MAETPRYTRRTVRSSRTVYLLRRIAGGCIIIGALLLIFGGDSTAWTTDLAFVGAGVILWIVAGAVERSSSHTVEVDERGNAVRKDM